MIDFAADVIRTCARTDCGNGMCEFMEQIGPTLLGVKPASILSIRAQGCIDLCRERFTEKSPVAYFEILGDKGRQLFLYHKEKLTEVLADTKVRRYLAQHGYPLHASTEEYVRVLRQKLHGGEFPHEIGVFMGYPLKDVYGYMGARIPYKKTMGWRMYGDTRESEAVYHRFKAARCHVKDMILACKPA